MKLVKHLVYSTAILLTMSLLNAHATSLLLDFGPTVATSTDALKSPGHAAGAVPETEVAWNRITSDTNTLYYGDGSLAAGVTLELGRSTAVGPVGDDIINYADNGFTVNALGTTINTGVYAGTSPVRDGIFAGAGGTNNLALGLRIDGLPAGPYRIFVHGRNSNTAGRASLLFYAKTGPSAGTYAFGPGDIMASTVNSSPAVVNGFIKGDNYDVIEITVAAGESLYIASEGTVDVEMRGFFNAISIVAGTPDLPAKITAHPVNRTVLGTGVSTMVADGYGAEPLFLQWRLNNVDLTESEHFIGVNSNVLTLRNVTDAMAGNYSLFVSNALGTDVSSNGVLTVIPALNTEQMTNIWNLAPGDRPYIGLNNTERSIAFNPVTTNVLLASRALSNTIVVLDANTGAEKHFLDVSDVIDGTLTLNQIAVADDGAVYAANLTTTATSPQYKIYRWANDDPGVPPVAVFIGDPAADLGLPNPQPNRRWGDNLAVRGAGADTQILIAPGNAGTNVVLLRTASGLDFQTEVPPAIIAVSGVPTSFGGITTSLAWGPTTNTFWAKTGGGVLYLIEFDLNTYSASVIRTYPSTLVASSVRGISTDPTRAFLAGVAIESPNDNVRLYDVSDLDIGPLMRDQEAFTSQNANANGTAATAFGGHYLFAVDSNNGIKAFVLNTNYVPPSVTIVTHPADRTVMEGATAVFTSTAASDQPLVYQWRFNDADLSNGPNIIGANTDTLIVQNVTEDLAGGYSLVASNVFGSATSSVATLTILPAFNTPQMSNIWSVQPGERFYIGTNTSTERGLAFNPATSNLLIVSRLSDNPLFNATVAVLDFQTGAEKHFLDTTGIPGSTGGVSLGLNTIGVADDGVVFGAGVTVSAQSPPFEIYRWADDSPGNPPVLVFSGDPGAELEPNLGYTDAIAVRGAGPDTQILVAPRGGTNVVILRSSSGLDFQTEIPPTVIAVSDVPPGFAQTGIAFGPGTNTFWAKTFNQALYLVEFDINAKTGTVIYSSTNGLPLNMRHISTDENHKFLAGITTDPWPNVRLYDISNLAYGPVLRDQEAFATSNPNVTVGGTGDTAFGGNYLFALDSNNGLKAFLIDTNYVPPAQDFSITSVVQQNGSIIFSWPSVVGVNYQVQSKQNITAPGWDDVGGLIPGTGGLLSFTNSTANGPLFFRVEAQ